MTDTKPTPPADLEKQWREEYIKYSKTLEFNFGSYYAPFRAAKLSDWQAMRELVEAAKGVLGNIDCNCRLDHHGNCQEHFLENPCSVLRLSSALHKLEGK